MLAWITQILVVDLLASTFSCVSYSPLIFWFLSHRRFSTHFSRNVVSQNFRNFRFLPERLAQKSELSLPSNGYPSQGPTEPPLHRNSALLVEAHWSVAFSCRGTTPDFGPRPLCVLESCLFLSRTATHGQSPSSGVDVPSLTYSLCWRSHLRREALRPMLCLPDARHKPTRPLDVDTCFARPCARCFVCPSRCHDFLVKSAQSHASRGLAPDALSAQLTF